MEETVEEFDVVVLGSGAAALTAAVTAAEEGAKVGLFEKGEKLGGTSAWSGGQVWIPNNPHMPEVGVPDSRGAELCRYLEARPPVHFYAVKDFPDYHPEFPGGSPKGGRTLECPIYPYDEL